MLPSQRDAFDMPRELPRTLLSLSRRMQRGVEGIDYEVIVVDNGSDPPIPASTDPDVSVFRDPDAFPSPAAAINRAIARCRHELIGVLIDGARMASPGLVHHVDLASRLHHRPVIATLGFHLGPDVQYKTRDLGYDRVTEDALLRDARWEEDGYRLFEISVFAASSSDGWFGQLAESNALFMPRAMWTELNGLDERFAQPGGGLVNLDLFERAVALPDSQVIVLLGEGTFHQFHGGGIATNSVAPPWEAFHAEYEALHGRRFATPSIDPIYLGRLPPVTTRSVWISGLRRAAAAAGLSGPQ